MHQKIVLTLNDKGQVTIPKKIRTQLGLINNTQIPVEIYDGKMVIEKNMNVLSLRQIRDKIHAKMKNTEPLTISEIHDRIPKSYFKKRFKI